MFSQTTSYCERLAAGSEWANHLSASPRLSADNCPTHFLPYTGKEKILPIELDQLFGDFDHDELRFRWPSKFIFFCGGKISSPGSTVSSLRGYLLNDRRIARRVKAEFVLAESANQIWQTTTYRDLITFEEDIAKIAALVLVIAESPGALAELGAFSADPTIRKSLTILIQDKYETDQSFIRLGPVERIYKDESERVAFYPWLTRKGGALIKKSIKPHVRDIVSFLNKRIRANPDTARLSLHPDIKDFILLYWVIHLSLAIPLGKLANYSVALIGQSDHRVRQMLYCMKIAGWVRSKHYSNVEYYYASLDTDPLIYRFRNNLPKDVRDASRRRTEVTISIQKDLQLPRHIKEIATAARRLPVK